MNSWQKQLTEQQKRDLTRFMLVARFREALLVFVYGSMLMAITFLTAYAGTVWVHSTLFIYLAGIINGIFFIFMLGKALNEQKQNNLKRIREILLQ